ncbi:MAG: response regulator [Steroidobacteraceae bacterium]
MSQKRALVVDDSKSARAFLIRILERHALKVDAAGSAEEAMSYLGEHQPDVIFMDHLMPGMDGFQALQAIKNNPDTATIPVMMYTSQEGELYLSQARALGAIGVLPKQIRHVDVAKALEQLKLVDEIRPTEATIEAAAPPETLAQEIVAAANDVGADSAAPAVVSAAPSLAAVRGQLDAALREQSMAFKRFVTEQFDQYAERVVGDLRVLAQYQQEQAAAAPPPVPLARRPLGWGLLAAGAAAALAIALLAVFWMRAADDQKQLAARLQQAQQQLASVRQQLDAARQAATDDSAAPGSEALSDADVQVLAVPFGEVPLSGARVEPVQAQLARLAAQGFRGVVQLRIVPGRFCLSSGSDGMAPAAGDLLYARCDLVGNPPLDSASVTQRESVAFANMVAAARKSAGDAYDVQISVASADDTLRAYPAGSDTLTAGDWNKAAVANNRVEMRWRSGP